MVSLVLEIPRKYLNEVGKLFAPIFRKNEWKWANRDIRKHSTYVPDNKQIAEEVARLLSDMSPNANYIECGRLRIDRTDTEITISLIADSVTIPINEVKEVLKVDVDDIQS